MMTVRPPAGLLQVELDVAAEGATVAPEDRAPEVGAGRLVPDTREYDLVPVSVPIHNVGAQFEGAFPKIGKTLLGRDVRFRDCH